MSEFQHPFGRHPVDPYVSPEKGMDHYECDCGCAVDLRIDVRDIFDVVISLLKHPDHSSLKDELREALGLPKKNEDSG